ncbi:MULTISPECIES: hypothetical protein [Anaerolinea]|uniref:hypothetical protein n=1 Tax=Anaerolinea TaxID=233189 RepID=UPI002630D2ED|nr:hypothetical protein [Anaerolinea thermophila]
MSDEEPVVIRESELNSDETQDRNADWIKYANPKSQEADLRASIWAQYHHLGIPCPFEDEWVEDQEPPKRK